MPLAPDAAPGPRPASLPLVLAAAFYDALLCVGIAIIAAALAVAANAGQAIAAGSIWFELYLVAAMFPYFAWCWTRAGRTLGMRAWKLGLSRGDGTRASTRDALVRYLVAWLTLGTGFLWMLVDRAGMSAQDRLSGTRIHRDP